MSLNFGEEGNKRNDFSLKINYHDSLVKFYLIVGNWKADQLLHIVFSSLYQFPRVTRSHGLIGLEATRKPKVGNGILLERLSC